jgi:hypothetical protein
MATSSAYLSAAAVGRNTTGTAPHFPSRGNEADIAMLLRQQSMNELSIELKGLDAG